MSLNKPRISVRPFYGKWNYW